MKNIFLIILSCLLCTSAMAQESITTEPDINTKDSQGNTLFMKAAQSGDVTEMFRLVKEGAKIDLKNNNSETALFHAIRSSQPEAVQFLMERKLSTNQTNRDGQTPLAMAIENRDMGMANLLLSYKAEPSSGLDAAAKINDSKMFKQLIDQGGRVSSENTVKTAINNSNMLITRLALENGAQASYVLNQGIEKRERPMITLALKKGASSSSAVQYAVSNDDLDLFKDCLGKYRADANDALGKALAASRLEMAEFGLQRGGKANDHINQVVKSGSSDGVALLLKYNASAVKILSAAVSQNRLAIAQQAINSGVRAQDPSLIKTACRNTNLEMVRLLIQNDANPNDGLLTAIEVKSEAIVEELLNKNAKPDPGMPPAIKQGSGNLVRLLLTKGANGTKPEYMKTAAQMGNDNIVSQLLAKGSNPDAGITGAVQNGHINVTQLLIKANANVQDPQLLKMSVTQNITEISMMLLKKGAPATYVSASKENLLHMACNHQNLEVSEALIEKGVEVNQATSQGYTPLHIGAQKGNSAIVNLLLSNGASVNALTTDMQSALHFAVKVKSRASVNSLVQNGASVNVQDNVGNSPLHHACKNLDQSITAILVSNQAELNVVNHLGDYPIHYAVSQKKNQLGITQVLVDAGADINVKNRKGTSVLKLAKGTKLKRYLKEQGAVKK